MERTAGRRGLSRGWFTVAAALAAAGCFGHGGGPDAPGGGPVGVPDPPPAPQPPPPPAPPPPGSGAGWLVADRRTPGQEGVEVHAADVRGGAPVERVAGAAVLGVIAGAGVVYGRDRDALGWAEVGLFRPGDARRIALAAEPGHRYTLLADVPGAAPFLVGGRLILADVACAGAVTLRSVAVDGSGARLLTAGPCAAVTGARLRGEGVAFRCEPYGVYFSDGGSPAVRLPGLGADARPLEVAATGGRTWVVLDDAARVVAAPADGSRPPIRLSPAPAGADALVALSGGTAVVTTALGAADHATYTVSVDGAAWSARRLGASAPTVAGAPAVTTGGLHVLAILGGDDTTPARAVLLPADPADPAVVELPASAGTDALAVTRFTTGEFLVKLAGTGYHVVTASGDAGPLLDAFGADLHVADAGRWAVFQSPQPPHPMKAVPLDRTEYFPLTSAGTTASPPLVSAAGTIFFLDAAGATWAAAPEVGQRLSVDAAPGDALRLTGTLGARELVAVHHVAGDDVTYAVDPGSGSVEVVLPGATGWSLP